MTPPFKGSDSDNSGVWVRWAIGLTLGLCSTGLAGGIGFANSQSNKAAAMQRQIDDFEKATAQDREQFRREMQYRFDDVTRRVDDLRLQLRRQERDDPPVPVFKYPK